MAQPARLLRHRRILCTVHVLVHLLAFPVMAAPPFSTCAIKLAAQLGKAGARGPGSQDLGSLCIPVNRQGYRSGARPGLMLSAATQTSPVPDTLRISRHDLQHQLCSCPCLLTCIPVLSSHSTIIHQGSKRAPRGTLTTLPACLTKIVASNIENRKSKTRIIRRDQNI